MNIIRPTCLLIMLVSLIGCQNHNSISSSIDLPPGFSVVYDGENYRYKWPHGAISSFDQSTRIGAAEAAWRSYNFAKDEQNRTWIDVK